MSRASRTIGLMAAIADILLVGFSFWAAYQIRIYLGAFPTLDGFQRYWTLAVSGSICWAVFGFFFGLYSGREMELFRELRALIKVGVLTGLVLASLAFLLKQEYQSRPLMVIYMVMAVAQTVTLRALLRLSASYLPRAAHRVIVVGTGAQAEQICRIIRRSTESGLELVGVIPEEKGGRIPPGTVKLGELQECEAIFRREIVDEVIFAVPRTRLVEVENAFAAAEDLGLDTKLCLTFLPNRFAKVSFTTMDRTPMLSFSSAPSEPIQLALKRAFDIVVSIVALVLSAPLFLVVAVLIKLDSKGPVFFSQSRTGLNGREFRLWKFRSMVVDAEARLKQLADKNEMTGPVFKVTKDPRITRVGAIIRKMSIDELPQFYNVLIGDMSVVGPRPLFDVKQYDERWQCRRLSVRPGITCTWQISGRNEIDFPTWMKLDLDYIDKWSFGLDLKIFLKTIPAVLFGRGAR